MLINLKNKLLQLFFIAVAFFACPVVSFAKDIVDVPLKSDKWIFKMGDVVNFTNRVPVYNYSSRMLDGPAARINSTKYFTCETGSAKRFISGGKPFLYTCSVRWQGDYQTLCYTPVTSSALQARGDVYVYRNKGCKSAQHSRVKGNWEDIGGGELIVTAESFESVVSRLKQEADIRSDKDISLGNAIGELEKRLNLRIAKLEAALEQQDN